MTPDQLAAFRARLAGDVAPAPMSTGVPQFAPAPGEGRYFPSPSGPAGPTGPATGTDSSALSTSDEMIHRARDFGGGFAANPGVRGLASIGNPTAGPLGAAAEYATSRLGIGRREGTFTRETEGEPQHVELRPMADSGPVQDVRQSPTLDPSYGRAAPRASGGGMAGAGSSMGGLARSYRQAQENQFGAFNKEQDLVEHRGDLQSSRTEEMAKSQELDAARKMRDAEVKAHHDQQAAQKHEAFLQRNTELADQIGAEKIDPSKVIGDMGVGQKIMMLIAGGLSGASGQGPQFMARLDRMVDQGVKAQIANADNKKAKLSARQSLFDRMMAESGDRKVAEAQTRLLINESVKQKMSADAERLGIPEMKVNAELMRNEIDERKINPLRVQLTGEAYRTAMAQAAAAAAAQRAAEDRAWKRGMEMAELGIKKDAQTIEIAKIDSKNKEDINAETRTLGKELADPKLAAGRAAVENSKRRLGIAEDGTVVLGKDGKPVVDQKAGLPGVGGLADFRDKVAGRPQGANALNPGAWVNNAIAGLNDDERVSRGDWDKMALAYQVQVTGSGGSEEQMRQIRSAFSGAKTAKEQRNAVAEADAVFRQIESRHKAGVSPAARRAFEDRLNGIAPAMPSTVTVKK